MASSKKKPAKQIDIDPEDEVIEIEEGDEVDDIALVDDLDPDLDPDDLAKEIENDPLLEDDDFVAADDDETDDTEAMTPASRRAAAASEEEEDDDLTTPDDVEEDLDKILKDRLVAADDVPIEDDDEEGEVDERNTDGDRLQPRQAGEEMCSQCFLLVRRSAPNCPVGDDACSIFAVK
ncbi:MAG: hypothetical protein NWR88_08590 [Ilumatobacteraceae bacterium]|jgi:hypothetical protein|nr:hypothetical protein [Ilumatobacteraceae bacterium]